MQKEIKIALEELQTCLSKLKIFEKNLLEAIEVAEGLIVIEAQPQPNYSSFTDPRDGRTYRTVKIGEQVWMAENLAFAYAGSKCYDNDLNNADKYGLLYNWETAIKACPPGWHLPSDAEWDELLRFIDGNTGSESPYESDTAGKHLKAKSGWKPYEDVENLDTYGFSALPGGGRSTDGTFTNVGSYGLWWSATQSDSSNAYYRLMPATTSTVGRNSYAKAYSYSVRCVQDSVT
jgi:uncharacterized protein (TIGR02145 family)